MENRGKEFAGGRSNRTLPPIATCFLSPKLRAQDTSYTLYRAELSTQEDSKL